MAQRLTSFTISSEADGYIMHIEGEGGAKLDLSATYDQLDVIAETIDRQLDTDEEEALEVGAATDVGALRERQ